MEPLVIMITALITERLLFFTEEFRVDDCADTAIVHNTYWGCSAGEICQAAEPQTGSLNFGANVPDIALTKVGSTNPDLCEAVTYTVRIENTNATAGSMALDVGIILGRGGNATPVSTADSNPLWGYERLETRKFSNFRFGANPSFTPNNVTSEIYATTTTNVIPPNFFTSDPDGAGGFDDLDNDGFYDDLPPGESTELSFDFELTPKDNCGTGRFDYLEWEHTYFDVFFKDQCKSDRIPERIDLNYFNIIRDYRSVTEIDAPTDIVNNEDFSMRIAPSMQANGAGHQRSTEMLCLQIMVIRNGVLHIEVPTGMSLQPSASSEFTQIGNP